MKTKINKNIENIIRINMFGLSFESSFLLLNAKIFLGLLFVFGAVYWFFRPIAGYIGVGSLIAFIGFVFYAYLGNKKHGKYGFHYKKLNNIGKKLMY